MNSEKAIRTIFSSLLVLFLIHKIIKNLLGENILNNNFIKIYKLGANAPVLINAIKYPLVNSSDSTNNNSNTPNSRTPNSTRLANKIRSANRNRNKKHQVNFENNYEKEKQDLLNYIIKNSSNVEDPPTLKPNNYFNTTLNGSASEPEQSDFTIAQTDLSTYFQNNESQHPKKKIIPPNCNQEEYDKMSKTFMNKSKGGPGSADSVDPNLIATYSNETIMNGGNFGSVTGFDGLSGAFASIY